MPKGFKEGEFAGQVFKKGNIPWNKVPRQIVKCFKCGKEFGLPKYRIKNVKRFYCSRECRKDSIMVPCSNCGKMVKRNRSHLTKYKSVFCSKKCAQTTLFKKNLIPWNRDKKGIHLSPTSEFKKGIVPENKLPIGSIQIRKGHDGHKRKWIKIAEPNKWMLNSRYVYSQYEEILSRNLIHHSDEDTLNDDPENLEQLTRAEHMEWHRDQLLSGKMIK